MKRLTCEMCGSIDLIKKEGLFECQNCGTKYSVEEAKKMMVEGVVEVQGTVKIDSSNKIDNLLKNAKILYQDGKTGEAYNLFGEVLNIDTENYIAIAYRGLSSAWTTSVTEPKQLDAVRGVARSLELALKKLGNSKEYLDFSLEIGEEIDKIGSACLKLYIDYYTNASNAYVERIKELTSSMKKAGIYADVNFYKRQEQQALAKVNQAEKNCKEGTELTIASLNTVLIKILLAKDVIYSVKDYKKMRSMIETYLKKSVSLISKDQLNKGTTLMVFCDKKIKEHGDKKREEYWQEHQAEKQELDKQIQECEQKLEKLKNYQSQFEQEKTALEQKMNTKVPAEEDLEKIENKLEKLQEEKNSLGLFKGKEKKIVQEKIDGVNQELEAIKKEVQQEKEELKKQYMPNIEEITEKLSKIEKEAERITQEKEQAENELNKDRD